MHIHAHTYTYARAHTHTTTHTMAGTLILGCVSSEHDRKYDARQSITAHPTSDIV